MDILNDDVKRDTVLAIEKAKTVAITTPEQYKATAELLKGIKSLRQRIEETFKPIIEQAHKAHKAETAALKQHVAPVEEAENIIKRKISDYLVEEERKRREAERIAQDAARKAAEEEALRQAEEAEKAGDKEAAEAIIQTPVVAPVVIVQKSVEKIEGISGRTNWKFRITDEMKVPREYLMVDEKKIGAVVRAMKGETKISGIQAYPEASIAVGVN